MLATVIPYFLLASISNQSVWQNGPEFKFDSHVEVRFIGLNGTNQVTGFNITNEYTCRPKTESSLQCQFHHKKMLIFEVNIETGKIINSKEMSNANSYILESFPFGIEFDKNGANKIILNETSIRNGMMLNIATAMANALNVATNLSEVKLSAEPIELEQVNNIILSKCKGKVTANLVPSSEGDESKNTNWNSELSPPLEKLGGRNLNIMKTWNLTDCKTVDKFFWFGMFVAFDDEHRPREVDVTVNLAKIDDRIAVSRGSLDYQSGINIEIISKKKNIPEEVKLNVSEFSEIRLSGIQPAVETWPEIENAVTIPLNEQK